VIVINSLSFGAISPTSLSHEYSAILLLSSVYSKIVYFAFNVLSLIRVIVSEYGLFKKTSVYFKLKSIVYDGSILTTGAFETAVIGRDNISSPIPIKLTTNTISYFYIAFGVNAIVNSLYSSALTISVEGVISNSASSLSPGICS